MITQATSPPTSPSSSPGASQQGSPAGGYEVVTTFNQQGFPVVVTQPKAEATAVKHYDDKGFLITTAPAQPTHASAKAGSQNVASPKVEAIAASASSIAPSISKTTMAPTSAASRFELSGVLLMALLVLLEGFIVVGGI